MTEKPGKDNIRKKKSLIAKIYRQKQNKNTTRTTTATTKKAKKA